MVEEMELKLRTTLQTIYFGKTRDIVNELRQSLNVSAMQQRNALQAELGRALGGK